MRGEPSHQLPLTSFVSFLQNHDQIGNRAFGERIVSLTNAQALRAALAILLLAPSPPLLFMGEEFGASTPFLFFSDFGPELANKVREGRRAEFSKFEQFSSAKAQQRIPGPNDPATFLVSKIDWSWTGKEQHFEWLDFYRTLLSVRRKEIVPLLKQIVPGAASYEVLTDHAIYVRWTLTEYRSLELLANLSTLAVDSEWRAEGTLVYATTDTTESEGGSLPPFSTAWFLSK